MEDSSSSSDLEIPITTWSAAAACVAIVLLLFIFQDWYSALACVPGALLGWIMGVLFSPYEDEKLLFAGYAKTAAAFVTGFLVSKLDRVFELFVASKTGSDGPLILAVAVWRPLVFALSSLMLVLIYTFTCRHYGQRAARQVLEAKKLKADADVQAIADARAAAEAAARANAAAVNIPTHNPPV
jgi:hypothetical protein